MTDLADRSVAGDKEVDMTQVASNEQTKAKKEKIKKEPKQKQPQMKKKLDDSALIGITSNKEDDLAAWYQETLQKGDFLEYSDIPGCYIINVRYLPNPTARITQLMLEQPSSYAIWEAIQAFLNKRIKKLGVRNCYFPIFISEANLQVEKEHLEGFEAEVAWVTHG